MTSLWPQIEPILAHVQKPARYIGCEDGAIGPGSTDALLNQVPYTIDNTFFGPPPAPIAAAPAPPAAAPAR